MSATCRRGATELITAATLRSVIVSTTTTSSSSFELKQ
jgi:hypothetical protein